MELRTCGAEELALVPPRASRILGDQVACQKLELRVAHRGVDIKRLVHVVPRRVVPRAHPLVAQLRKNPEGRNPGSQKRRVIAAAELASIHS